MTAIGNRQSLIASGLLKVVAGSLSIAAGGWLAASSEQAQYDHGGRMEADAISTSPAAESEEVATILLSSYSTPRYASHDLIESLKINPDQFMRFMMNFKHQMEKPTATRPFIVTAVMVTGYSITGVLPLIPFFIMKNINHALFIAIAISVASLTVFDFFKDFLATDHNVRARFKGAASMVGTNVLAIGASDMIGKLVSRFVP